MFKKLNIFALTLLLVGQIILGPIATVSAQEITSLADEEKTALIEDSNEVNTAEPKVVNTPTGGDGTVVTPESEETPEVVAPSATKLNQEQGGVGASEGGSSKVDGKLSVDSPDKVLSVAGEEDATVLSASTGNPVANDVMNITDLEIGHLNGDGVADVATKTGDNYFLDIDTTKFGPENTYYVKFNFKLDSAHTVQPGDYYEFQVPTAFQLTEINNRPLGDDGLATYSITTDGKVTITFTEDIINAGGQAQPIDNGKFDAAWALSSTAKTGDLVKEYPFNIDGSKKFILTVANTDGKTIEKRKIDGHGNNPKTVKWQVDVNTNTNDISGLTLKDSLTVVPGSIEVVELEPQINGTANVKAGTATGHTLTGNNFPITFDNSKKAYRITYETEVGSPGPGHSTIFNTATLEGTGGDFDTATHSVYFDEPIKKSVDINGVQYPAGTLQWTVEVNADGRDISGGVTVTDTLTLPATTNSADLNLMAFDAGSVNFSPAVKNQRVNVNGDELTIYFEPAAGNEETYTITYNTVDAVVDKNYNFKNEAVLTYTDYTDEYKSGEKIGTVNHQMLTKTGQTGDAIDYLNKTIDWEVTFNTSGYDAIYPVVITDEFNSDGKYFRMYEDEFTNVPTNFKLELTYPKYDNGRAYTEEGFTLTATGQVNEQVTFTYPTHFDSTVDYTNNQIKNDVQVEWEKNGQKYTNEDSFTSIFNTFTANNGQKKGTYDPVNKAVEWTLDVNYREFSLPEAQIVDKFGDKQTMAVVSKDTVKVELLNMAATPTVAGDFTNYTVTGTGPAGNYTGFELNFGETIDKAYRVTYTTEYNEQFIGEFTDQKNKAKNTAKFTSQGKKVTDYDTEDLNTSPTVTNAGEYFSKNGRDIPNVDYLEWKFKLNESQSHIKTGSTIHDTMNDGQVLVEDFTGLTLAGLTSGRGTFEIKKRNYTRSENNFSSTLDLLTPEEVNDLFTIAIAPDKKSFTLTLKQDINHEYEISYVTDISASALSTLSNTYTYNFNGKTKEETKTQKVTNVTYEYSGGTANLRKYNLNITKKDGYTNDALPGVEFGIYLGNIEVATATTDGDGKLQFPEIKYGTYTLKELNAASNEYSTEFKIDGKTEFVDEYTFTTSGTTKNLTLEAINKKTCDAFTLTVKYDGNPVQAGVNVVIKDKTRMVADVAGKTNADGKIVFDKTDLPKGEYEVFDIANPANKLGDITVLYLQGDCEAEVTWASGTDVSCPLFTLTVKENGTAVGENMKITLQDATDNTKVVTAYTNDQGKIEYDKTALPAGTYDVFNNKNEKIGTVEVESLVVCEDEIDLAAGSINTCPIFTLTVNDRNDNPRENVEVIVKDASGKKVEGVDANGAPTTNFTTDTDGKVTFPYVIERGTYTVFEVDANDNEKRINSFTVLDTCEASVKPSSGGGGWIPPAPTCDNFTVTVKQDGKVVEANTEITLKDSTGKEVATGKTNQNGEIKFEKTDLPEGTYTVTDKDGKDVGTITVTYEEDKCQAEVNLLPIAPTCDNFTLTITDTPNAKVDIKDKAGTVIVSGTTDSNGKVVFSQPIQTGEYDVYVNNQKLSSITVTNDCKAVIDPEDPGTDPEKPTDPEEPGTNPEKPTNPEEPSGEDSEDVNGENPTKPGDNGNLNPDEDDKGQDVNGNVKPDTGDNSKDNGVNKLPQTGEEVFLYMLVLGILFVTAGGWIFCSNKRKKV